MKFFVLFHNFVLFLPWHSVWAQTALDFEGGTASDTINPGEFRYFEVTIPAERDGWRVALASDADDGISPDDPDLYIRKLEAPSTNQYDRRSQNISVDTAYFTDQ